MNYIEYVVYENLDKGYYNIDLPRTQFEQLLSKLGKETYSCFVKRSKVFRIDDMYYEVDLKDNDYKHYRKIVKDTRVTKNIIVLKQHKEKIPFHSFPCTYSLHDMFYSNKLIFKVHNRIYINFEQQYYQNSKIVHKVFINYNYETNVEQNIIIQLLHNIGNILNLDLNST